MEYDMEKVYGLDGESEDTIILNDRACNIIINYISSTRGVEEEIIDTTLGTIPGGKRVYHSWITWDDADVIAELFDLTVKKYESH